MSTPINLPLYRLLLKTGASEADAEEAARTDTTNLATKADLKQFIAQLQSFLLPLLLGALVVIAFLVGLVCIVASE